MDQSFSCPSNQVIELPSGEIPCRATKHQSTNLGLGLNMEMSKGSGGKRLDLQCRGVEKLEINNSEFKRSSTSGSQVDQQLQKNVLINHSMVLYLKEEIGLPLDQHEVQALNVHGKNLIRVSISNPLPRSTLTQKLPWLRLDCQCLLSKEDGRCLHSRLRYTLCTCSSSFSYLLEILSSRAHHSWSLELRGE